MQKATAIHRDWSWYAVLDGKELLLLDKEPCAWELASQDRTVSLIPSRDQNCPIYIEQDGEFAHFLGCAPRFEHDCDHCEFLGNFFNLDVWVCERPLGASYIARFGNDGPDYFSMPQDVLFQSLVNPHHITGTSNGNVNYREYIMTNKTAERAIVLALAVRAMRPKS